MWDVCESKVGRDKGRERGTEGKKGGEVDMLLSCAENGIQTMKSY